MSSESDDIVSRLRNYDICNDVDIDIAADMLEFFLSQMQSHSLNMDGTAGYRLHSSWPLTSVRAKTPEGAIVKCIDMIKEARKVIDGEH